MPKLKDSIIAIAVLLKLIISRLLKSKNQVRKDMSADGLRPRLESVEQLTRDFWNSFTLLSQ